eukprot:scpid56622/ scgid6936/ 
MAERAPTIALSFYTSSPTRRELSVLLVVTLLGLYLLAGRNISSCQISDLLHSSAAASSPTKAGNVAAKSRDSLAIRAASFVYMMQLRGSPGAKWIRRSNWKNTAVISLSWKENITTSAVANHQSNTFRMLYMPNSTWTTGRNRLLREAIHIEQAQKWKFEFVLFLDEDAALAYRSASHPDVVIRHRNDDMALRKLNDLLVRDRPMRAGIGFNPTEDLDGPFTRENFGCVRKCHMDPIVSAYHRTAVDILLPYTTLYDTLSWYASGVISDLYASAVVPSYCHVYQEVLVDLSQQLHNEYPKDMDLELPFHYINNCLSTAGFRDFINGTSVPHLKNQLTRGMGYHGGLHMDTRFRQVGEYPCSRQLPGVDYEQKLGTDITSLWNHCLNATRLE